jgi:hypothetical protein
MAEEIALEATKSSISPELLIFSAVIAAMIVSIVYLLYRLKWDERKITISIGKFFLLAIGINIPIMLIIVLREPLIQCMTGAICPTNMDIYLNIAPYTLGFIFLITYFCYLIVVGYKARHKK